MVLKMLDNRANEAEREQLRRIIQQWNENRLDLFSLTEPNEELEFHGVMRFYMVEAGQRVSSKCVRVSSTGTARAVIDALVPKFLPDMRMLTQDQYSLWELLENGQQRKLQMDEKPLLVQLNWHKDDREGRFLLKREGQPMLPLHQIENSVEPKSMKRKLSKREKKEAKRANKLERASEAEDLHGERLYAELPQGCFTRTISNPEIVMKKRRERKLEAKLRDIEGGGGSLKIYGESLNPDKPYVTLLLSVRDSVARVLKEALEKYGLDKCDPRDFCLVLEERVVNGDANENVVEEIKSQRILDDQESPLVLLAKHADGKTSVVFHVRSRSIMSRSAMSDLTATDHGATRAATVKNVDGGGGTHQFQPPFLIELNSDGSEVHGEPKIFLIPAATMHIGSDRALDSSLDNILLFGPYVHPRHCCIYWSPVEPRQLLIAPLSKGADLRVNGQSIDRPQPLVHGCSIRIGRSHMFRFCNIDQMDEKSVAALSAHQQPPPHQTTANRHQTPSYHYDKPQVAPRAATAGPPQNQHMMPPQRVNSVPLSSAAAGGSSSSHMETTFELDGQVETTAHPSGIGSLSRMPPALSNTTFPTSSSDPHLVYLQQRASDIRNSRPIPSKETLPAIVELFDKNMDAFLSVVIREAEHSEFAFKLSVVYTVYMALRYRISPLYQVDLLPAQRAAHLARFATCVVDTLRSTIHDHRHDAPSMAFWLSQSSELLFLLRADQDLEACCVPEPAQTLGDSVQRAFAHLASCLLQDLQHALPPLLDAHLDDQGAAAPSLKVLGQAMALLRACRVNAALIIQLFSQLFHRINVFLFNWLVSREGSEYCCRAWGSRLSERLGLLYRWAERQGLEMAADCHLATCTQAAHLLTCPKQSPQTLANTIANCSRLNSLQIRCLLQRYRPVAPNEPHVNPQLMEGLIKMAEQTVDAVLLADGRQPTLEEEPELRLPFLLPDDGYSVEWMKGIPPPLTEFLEHLTNQGICRVLLQPGSSGTWNVHLGNNNQNQPQLQEQEQLGAVDDSIIQVEIDRGSQGIGLSIVAAEEPNSSQLGIYVKKVVPGTPAYRNGQISAGDQLLAVNGRSLLGLTQDDAAVLLSQAGTRPLLTVSRGQALRNGVAQYLNQSSPNGHQPIEARTPQSERASSVIGSSAASGGGPQRFQSLETLSYGLLSNKQAQGPPSSPHQQWQQPPISSTNQNRSMSTSNLVNGAPYSSSSSGAPQYANQQQRYAPANSMIPSTIVGGTIPRSTIVSPPVVPVAGSHFRGGSQPHLLHHNSNSPQTHYYQYHQRTEQQPPRLQQQQMMMTSSTPDMPQLQPTRDYTPLWVTSSGGAVGSQPKQQQPPYSPIWVGPSSGGGGNRTQPPQRIAVPPPVVMASAAVSGRSTSPAISTTNGPIYRALSSSSQATLPPPPSGVVASTTPSNSVTSTPPMSTAHHQFRMPALTGTVQRSLASSSSRNVIGGGSPPPSPPQPLVSSSTISASSTSTAQQQHQVPFSPPSYQSVIASRQYQQLSNNNSTSAVDANNVRYATSSPSSTMLSTSQPPPNSLDLPKTIASIPVRQPPSPLLHHQVIDERFVSSGADLEDNEESPASLLSNGGGSSSETSNRHLEEQFQRRLLEELQINNGQPHPVSPVLDPDRGIDELHSRLQQLGVQGSLSNTNSPSSPIQLLPPSAVVSQQPTSFDATPSSNNVNNYFSATSAPSLLLSGVQRQTSNTPQVIGTHEVYRDPREARLQQQQGVMPSVDGEKLSFKDKMKKFAAMQQQTSGNVDSTQVTPLLEKTKASRAQRQIEAELS